MNQRERFRAKSSPATFRRTYGTRMRMIGGVNKLVIPRGEAAIRAELEPFRPLVEEGGYIPMPDHRIPPDCAPDDSDIATQPARTGGLTVVGTAREGRLHDPASDQWRITTCGGYNPGLPFEGLATIAPLRWANVT